MYRSEALCCFRQDMQVMHATSAEEVQSDIIPPVPTWHELQLLPSSTPTPPSPGTLSTVGSSDIVIQICLSSLCTARLGRITDTPGLDAGTRLTTLLKGAFRPKTALHQKVHRMDPFKMRFSRRAKVSLNSVLDTWLVKQTEVQPFVYDYCYLKFTLVCPTVQNRRILNF